MKTAVVVEPADIKKMLAEKLNVKEESIINGQNSYTVVLKDAEKGDSDECTR